MDSSILAIYKVNSVGALRCEAIVNAILEGVADVTPKVCEEYGFKTYEFDLEDNGWVTITVFPETKTRDHILYSIMKHDNVRPRVSSLDIGIYDNGRHSASAYSWTI